MEDRDGDFICISGMIYLTRMLFSLKQAKKPGGFFPAFSSNTVRKDILRLRKARHKKLPLRLTGETMPWIE